MSEAEEHREKIVEAIKAGRITWAKDKEGLFISRDSPDFTVTSVKAQGGKTVDGGAWFGFEWETTSAGFGSTTFYLATDGTARCDNEAMDREFILSVFKKFLDGVTLEFPDPRESPDAA